jgi:hypothetical protein
MGRRLKCSFGHVHNHGLKKKIDNMGEMEVSVHCKAHDNINFVKEKVIGALTKQKQASGLCLQKTKQLQH